MVKNRISSYHDIVLGAQSGKSRGPQAISRGICSWAPGKVKLRYPGDH